jgi:hypothetical protein
MASAVDVSFITLFLPVLGFLLVAFVVAAILLKTQVLGENKWLSVFISLVVASIFVSFIGIRDFVLTVVPWFGALIVSLFLVLVLVNFAGANFLHKGIAIVFVILLGLVFIISTLFVFSEVIVKFLPGPSFGSGLEGDTVFFLDWLYSPRVVGALLLIIASALVSWVLIRGK